MPQREIDRWQRYWNEEPWGPYRDNLHTAMLICQLLRPHLKEGTQLSLQDFMFENPADRREREQTAAALKLDALARRAARQ